MGRADSAPRIWFLIAAILLVIAGLGILLPRWGSVYTPSVNWDHSCYSNCDYDTIHLLKRTSLTRTIFFFPPSNPGRWYYHCPCLTDEKTEAWRCEMGLFSQRAAVFYDHIYAVSGEIMDREKTRKTGACSGASVSRAVTGRMKKGMAKVFVQ